MELTEPVSDIISFHPYFINNANPEMLVTEQGFLDLLTQAVALAERNGKELYASETVWGALDDSERVKQIHLTLAMLNKFGIGFTVHALQHSMVADLHYPSHGPIGIPGAMHFINPDGTIRAGHEAFNEYC